MICNIDLFPTLLELAQVSVPANVQGRSFASTLRGDESPVRDELFGCYQEDLHTRCIRTPQYKLIRNFSGVRQHPVPVDLTYSPTRTTPLVELYALDADPLESCNVAGDVAYAQIRKALDQRLMAHLEHVNDPIVNGPVPMPYYRKAIADFRHGVKSDQ